MKKIALFTLLASLGTAAPASAQLVLGFHAGANISNVAGGADLDSNVGLNIGASILFPLSGSFGLYVGGSYSEKGASGSDGPVTAKINIDYIDVPVLLRYAVPISGPVGVHVYGGGAISFEIDCDVGVELSLALSETISVSSDCDVDELDLETETIAFGLMTGAGIDYGIGSGIDLVLDAFYNYGIKRGEDRFVGSTPRTFTVRAGVAIPLG